MTSIKCNKGATLVEFVLVLPLLLLFTFAIIEFGVLLFDKAVITNASREGARGGIVANYSFDGNGHAYYDPMIGTKIDEVVSDYSKNLLINFNGENIAETEAQWDLNSDGEYFLTVTVKYNYNFLVLPNILSLIGGSFNAGIPLAGKTRMRMELAEVTPTPPFFQLPLTGALIMKGWVNISKFWKDDNGSVLIFFAIFAPVAIGLTALAVDVGYLYGVRNELHNAADAGSLAGAAVLFTDNGSINIDANDEGEEAAALNSIGAELITEVTGQIGHWCFSCNGGDGAFTPIDDNFLAPTTLVGVSDYDLDTDPYFVNAVKMVAARSDTPSFFARIFGYDQFSVRAESVAYIGFASKSLPGDLDLPIAICERSILVDGNYSCNVGRAISSSTTSSSGYNTGGWTDFDQVSCNGSSQNEIKPYITCSDPATIPGVEGGEYMNTNGGQVTSLWDALYDFWLNCAKYDGDGDDVKDDSLDTNDDGLPDQLWDVTLPVIRCDSSNVGCSEVVGFVSLTIAWINAENNGPIPARMDTFRCESHPDPDPKDKIAHTECWNEFIEAFQLHDYDPLHPYDPEQLILPPEEQDKIVYFLPNCEQVDAFGTSGGRNFGIRAKIPIIVQ